MRLLRRGDKGDDVRQLQAALIAAGYQIAQDGDYGPATERVVRQLQRDHNLVADGVVGSKTWAALGQQDDDRLLSQADIELAAEDLGVEVAAVMAINEVESRGSGFLPDGRPVILFERHVMRRRMLANGSTNIDHWIGLYPNVVNSRTGGYLGNAKEWERLGLAWSIHPAAALESASWGLFQIMSYHWEHLGYDSAQAFIDAMSDSEGHQLNAFVRFIKAEPKLHQALRRLDFTTVAKLYNGPGFAKHNYHGRMQAAFNRHQEA